MRLRILDSALEDLDRARLFYERQGEGLGAYFLDSLFGGDRFPGALWRDPPEGLRIPSAPRQALPLWRLLPGGGGRRGGRLAGVGPETITIRHSQGAGMMANHSVEANRRPAAPLDVGRQFGSPFSAPQYFPATVAHLGRSAIGQTRI